MIVSIGFDHGAIPLRKPVLQALEAGGHTIIDHGTETADSVDYPDYVKLVAQDVTSGRCEVGMLCCTTGIGMSIAANKIKGIRAALVHYEDEASLARRHNDANVLCMGALHVDATAAEKLVSVFLGSSFEGGRHKRRVCKFIEWENDAGV